MTAALDEIAVLGPGGVGGLLAALLWRAGHAVTCVGKDAAAALIAREGLWLESAAFGSIHAHLRAASVLDRQVQLLIVATKATTLRIALRRVPAERVQGALILPLLNGIEHMDVLRASFGRRVIAASIGGVEAMKRADNRIAHTTPGAKIELASDRDVPPEQLAAVARLLTAAGIAVEVKQREADVLWGKLVRLNALACTTAASGLTMGGVRSDPAWRAQLEGCVREGAAVAAAEGVPMDPDAILAQISAFPAGITTSMHRDVAAGRPSELDAIAGAVVRAGARHRIGCPVIQGLMATIAQRSGEGRAAQAVAG